MGTTGLENVFKAIIQLLDELSYNIVLFTLIVLWWEMFAIQ